MNLSLENEAELFPSTPSGAVLSILGAKARTLILWPPSCTVWVSQTILVFGATEVKYFPSINTFKRTTSLFADTVMATAPETTLPRGGVMIVTAAVRLRLEGEASVGTGVTAVVAAARKNRSRGGQSSVFYEHAGHVAPLSAPRPQRVNAGPPRINPAIGPAARVSNL